MQQKFAVAELFFRYVKVYNKAGGGVESLCGREPPAALVEAAGGEGAVAAICGMPLSDVMATRLFAGACCSVEYISLGTSVCLVTNLHRATVPRMQALSQQRPICVVIKT